MLLRVLTFPKTGIIVGCIFLRRNMEMAVCLLRESLGEIVNQLGEMAERLRDKS